jgi:hypothetical protein
VYVAFRNTVLNIIDEMGNTCVKSNGKKRRPMGFLFGRTKKNRVAPDDTPDQLPKMLYGFPIWSCINRRENPKSL